METFLSQKELASLGLKSFGKNVKISRNACIYSPQLIEVGDNVRIDDYCVLSGHIKMGNFVHLSQFVCLYGGSKGIEFQNFVAVAARAMVYAISDDYVNPSLETPMVPMKYKQMIEGKVTICSHVIVGANTIILSGVTIARGSTFGALTLVVKDTQEYSVNIGIPSRKVRDRDRSVENMEHCFLSEIF